MRNFPVDQNASITVNFLVDGNLVPADANSVTYTVRNNSGGILTQDASIPNLAGDTQAILTIPAAQNTIADGLDFERRFVTLRFTHDGSSYEQQISYRVIPFIPSSATAQDVRNKLGLSSVELSDDDVDLVAAYFELRNKMTAGTLQTALTSGTVNARHAEEAIVISAAIQVLPSLQLRALQAKESDGSAARRFSELDIRQIRSDLTRRRSELVSLMIGQEDTELARVVLTNDTEQFPGG